MSASTPKPIFLTGLMGAGKSSVGKRLAQQMDWAFVDTDQMIVAEIGMSIANFFSKKGEKIFRELERMSVQRASKMRRTVVALGGGALMDVDNRTCVQSSGILVYLVASSAVLVQRLGGMAVDPIVRPLLLGLDIEGQRIKLESLLESRAFVYQMAQVQIDTDHKTIDEIVRDIAQFTTCQKIL